MMRGFDLSQCFEPSFQGVSDHCHYQGSIRGLKNSNVVLSTCSGLR